MKMNLKVMACAVGVATAVFGAAPSQVSAGEVQFSSFTSSGATPTPFMMIDPGDPSTYTPLTKPGSWSGYDSNQTLSVQLSSTGTFLWGDVIQQTIRAVITGTVSASGDVFKNGAKQGGCTYSKIGVAPSYSFHSSCPKSFVKGDTIRIDLNYAFTCYSRPCSIAVSKGFIVK